MKPRPVLRTTDQLSDYVGETMFAAEHDRKNDLEELYREEINGKAMKMIVEAEEEAAAA
jgi:hypothetical protein